MYLQSLALTLIVWTASAHAWTYKPVGLCANAPCTVENADGTLTVFQPGLAAEDHNTAFGSGNLAYLTVDSAVGFCRLFGRKLEGVALEPSKTDYPTLRLDATGNIVGPPLRLSTVTCSAR